MHVRVLGFVATAAKSPCLLFLSLRSRFAPCLLLTLSKQKSSAPTYGSITQHSRSRLLDVDLTSSASTASCVTDLAPSYLLRANRHAIHNCTSMIPASLLRNELNGTQTSVGTPLNYFKSCYQRTTNMQLPIDMPLKCYKMLLLTMSLFVLHRTRPEVARDDMSPQGCQKAKNAT
ncbi:hypothetical protein C8Q73DRAFT_784000 [Cubamyces lactineus]|nr:hypothetical protein C8Q73DRAFT_784000 [Cubamyces lactineus]